VRAVDVVVPTPDVMVVRRERVEVVVDVDVLVDVLVVAADVVAADVEEAG